MNTYSLPIPASDVICLLKAETKSALGQPELNTTCAVDYVVERDFDRVPYNLPDDEAFSLVTSVATLTIEPRVEQDYWILFVIVERSLGPVPVSEDTKFTPHNLTFSEFESELRASGQKRVVVRLTVQTPDVKPDFGRWLFEMEAHHPAHAASSNNEAASSAFSQRD